MLTTSKETGKFIPGIYNYCDRLCETCRFSHRCIAYDRYKKQEKDHKPGDESGWLKMVYENMEEAMTLVEKSAAEIGFDVKKEMNEEKLIEAMKEDTQRTAEHPLSLLAREYWKTCKAFLDNRKNITDDAKRLARDVAMGLIPLKDVHKEMKSITQSLELVQWYMFFIEAKLQRALYGLGQNQKNTDGVDRIQNDSNGSAKIALIAIDKSYLCWQILLKKMSTAEDVSLTCLGLLQKIKNMAIEEFPHAMEFKRPGFDG